MHIKQQVNILSGMTMVKDGVWMKQPTNNQKSKLSSLKLTKSYNCINSLTKSEKPFIQGSA